MTRADREHREHIAEMEVADAKMGYLGNRIVVDKEPAKMTRAQRNSGITIRAFADKVAELSKAIEFREGSVRNDKRWLEKATPENIELLIDNLVEHETELKMLRAMRRAVEELRYNWLWEGK